MTLENNIIYKAENTINGKIYIGKTNNFEKRKREHSKCYKKEDCIFHRAITKYGFENFEFEILEFNLTKKDASKREIYFIDKYNSYYKNENSKGYNMTRGGEGGNPWNEKEIIIFDKEWNVIAKFQNCTFASKFLNRSPETIASSCRRLGFSNGFIVRFKEDYNKYGKFIPNNRLNKTPKRPWRYKKVIQLSSKGEFIKEFNSIKEAYLSTNTSRTSLVNSLNNNSLANGFVWVYKNLYDESKDYSISEFHGKKINRIVQLTLNNEYVNTYMNCVEACKINNFSNYKNIHKAVKKINKTAFGFLWISEEEYLKDNTEVS